MILSFRHLLEKHDFGRQIFETLKAPSMQRGMAMKHGTIIEPPRPMCMTSPEQPNHCMAMRKCSKMIWALKE
jgi:IS5 family transposase